MSFPLHFSATRSSALKRVQDFLPHAPAYARLRNLVLHGHPHVSRLSPAIRHRLISEYEFSDQIRRSLPFSCTEKLLQEIYWRRYWKSYLHAHPEIWTTYLEELHFERNKAAPFLSQLLNAESGIAVFDAWVRELSETGYLHNHARMWFAALWIHHFRMPWALGADFFHSHLLDGDPAANTLSWRWVAGLHTPGKTYLARRSNLEKYLDADWLENHAEGLEALENPRAVPVNEFIPKITQIPHSLHASTPTGNRLGLLIHEDNLSPEQHPSLEKSNIQHIAIIPEPQAWQNHAYSHKRREFLRIAREDAAKRAAYHWKCEITWTNQIQAWATEHQIDQIVTPLPEIGPTYDDLRQLQTNLKDSSISLVFVKHPRDQQLEPFGKRGFFPFWKQTCRLLSLSPVI